MKPIKQTFITGLIILLLFTINACKDVDIDSPHYNDAANKTMNSEVQTKKKQPLTEN